MVVFLFGEKLTKIVWVCILVRIRLLEGVGMETFRSEERRRSWIAAQTSGADGTIVVAPMEPAEQPAVVVKSWSTKIDDVRRFTAELNRLRLEEESHQMLNAQKMRQRWMAVAFIVVGGFLMGIIIALATIYAM